MKIKTKAKCAQCGETYGAAQAGAHLLLCALRPVVPSRLMTEGYLIRISSAEQPDMYWMSVTIPIDAPLKLLDAFLREAWLECCGHLSEFVIGGRKIFSRTESGNPSQAMKNQVGKLLSPGAICKYTYDIGYRVSSHRGAQFRQWATHRLKEYIKTVQNKLLYAVTGSTAAEIIHKRLTAPCRCL